MTFERISVEPMSPVIGATVSGVDLNDIRDPAVYEEIRQALWKHHVIFFRNQPLEPDAYLRLGESFGDMENHEFFPHVEGYPQIQVIRHEGNVRPETDRWHTDVTFRERPSRVAILRAVKIPPSGGDTLWASTAAAFDALGPDFQRLLLALDARHDLPWSFRLNDNYRKFAEGRVRDGKPYGDVLEEELKMVRRDPSATHPAVITHPVTNRLTLFVNSIWTMRLEGIHPDLSDQLLRMMADWVKKPEFSCRFRWEQDSVAIWDNFATQHYATFDYGPHYREMQRMTCGSTTPQLLREHVPPALWPASRT